MNLKLRISAREDVLLLLLFLLKNKLLMLLFSWQDHLMGLF